MKEEIIVSKVANIKTDLKNISSKIVQFENIFNNYAIFENNNTEKYLDKIITNNTKIEYLIDSLMNKNN